MITFDLILGQVKECLALHKSALGDISEAVINRDLNGRVRLIVPEEAQDNPFIQTLATTLAERLAPHAYPLERMVLFEEDMGVVFSGVSSFPLDGFPNVRVVDRLATEGNWTTIGPLSPGAPRIVFFSIKGGVGRSTALAASAWSLAEAGKKVLVLDLDLESPGLSSALLPQGRRRGFGIVDWLVEDLVDNGDAVLDDMVASSTLSREGDIYVVAAHGRDPWEYIAKLGRVWMPKVKPDGTREPWSRRLVRLLEALEQRLQPDVVLLDSRAGIDEVASSCVLELGATQVLLFAIDSDQTWAGYRILFEHWRNAGVAQAIRERLQLVGAMVPDDEGRKAYLEGMVEQACDVFTESFYDEIPSGESTAGYFSFDRTDEAAPHYPVPIRWNRGFAALRSLHSRLEVVDEKEVRFVFGPLLDGLEVTFTQQGVRDNG